LRDRFGPSKHLKKTLRAPIRAVVPKWGGIPPHGGIS